MHLSPRELDKLTLHQAGVLGQKRLARGLRLNHPEAVALIATVILEFIRDDPGRGEVFGGIMTGTQLISIGLVVTGGLIWWLKSSARAVPAPAQR